MLSDRSARPEISLLATGSSDPVEPGDLIALLDAGAYGMAQSSNYNTRPACGRGAGRRRKGPLIRRRETIADLLVTETSVTRS